MNHKWTGTVWLFLLIAIQAFSNSTLQTLRAVRVDKGPKCDGYLDDKIWNHAIPFIGFKMVEPYSNSEPTEKTELRILYDQDCLYIGIYCYDSQPALISAKTMAHDTSAEERPSNDLIRILLDPFQDKRNSYIFFVNPRGARSEGLAFGEKFSLNWDGIWNARSQLLPDGWSTEIKIPFKTISFNSRLTQWGLNVERYIPRKLETIRISGTDLDSLFYNAMEAVPLEGITDIEQGRGITFRPYGITSISIDHQLSQHITQSADGGFDVYKNFTPNLVGAFSYNTDFAETEVDTRRINLTRFPLLFQEKRTFFLEGSEIFNFGTPGTGLGQRFIPFFSRKIGLYQGESIPVALGTKLYGKIGQTSLGLLDVQARRHKEKDLQNENFFAGRIYQNIWSQSKIGLIFTNGDSGGEGRNSLLGLDLTYSTSRFQGNKNLLAGTWMIYNWNQQESGKPYGFGLSFDYPNDLWNVCVTYDYFGDVLNPGLGFLPRSGIQTFRSTTAFKLRPEKGLIGRWIRHITFEFNPEFYWDLKGKLETYRIFTTPLNVRTEKGDRFEFGLVLNRDVLPYDFEIARNVVIPAGSYDFTYYSLYYSSASHRPLSGVFFLRIGPYYSGTYHDLNIRFDVRYKGYITLSFSTNIVRGHMPQGNFDQKVYRIKADFYFSPNIGLMNYIQYDNISNNLGINIRLRWEITPGNEIYFVYNKNWEWRWDQISQLIPLQDRGIFKIQFSIRP